MTIPSREQAVKDFEELVRKRRDVLISMRANTQDQNRVGRPNNYWETPCRCAPKVKVLRQGSWEGSAPLAKGVRIQIGCAKFVVMQAGCEEHQGLNVDS
jgi:hypothetical protein